MFRLKAKSDVPDVKPLAIGDSLPDLTLKNEKGEEVNVQGLAAENGLILFLVPRADTRECLLPKIVFWDVLLRFSIQVNFLLLNEQLLIPTQLVCYAFPYWDSSFRTRTFLEKHLSDCAHIHSGLHEPSMRLPGWIYRD